jgi:hypothetical protein
MVILRYGKRDRYESLSNVSALNQHRQSVSSNIMPVRVASSICLSGKSVLHCPVLFILGTRSPGTGD